MSILKKRSKSEDCDENTSPIRIAVLGATGVGKSSIISQFLHKIFNDEHRETFEDIQRKHLIIFCQDVTLDNLDTAGHSDLHRMRNLALAVSDAFVLVNSMADHRSFQEVKKLRDGMLSISSLRPDVPIVIVANKSDVQTDEVETKTRQAIVCIDWECEFVQVPAKNATNIEQIFQEIVRMTLLVNNKTPSAPHRIFSQMTSLERTFNVAARDMINQTCYYIDDRFIVMTLMVENMEKL